MTRKIFCSAALTCIGWVDQLYIKLMHCLRSALQLINLYNIKNFREYFSEKTWNCRESNPGQLVWGSLNAELCQPPPPRLGLKASMKELTVLDPLENVILFGCLNLHEVAVLLESLGVCLRPGHRGFEATQVVLAAGDGDPPGHLPWTHRRL